ncbi:MFS transporter [Anaplasma bovis]|uniref:MFS transporter n=1 Tax=Anaplasma bovis TaxID=186733 RepID=UPI002FEFC665
MSNSSVGFASRGFFAWFLIAMFYALQYIFRVMPNTFSEILMERYEVGAFALGQFSALYYVGYTAVHIPLGVLIDRYGPKKVVPICIFLAVLGVAPLLAKSWELVQVGRVITGMGSAAAALSIFKVSNMYYGKRFAIMTSVAMVIGFFGAMYGGMPLLTLSVSMGWTKMIAAMVVLGAIFSVFSSMLLFDTRDGTSAKKYGVYEQVKSVVCNGRLIVISLLGGCMIGSLEGFADGWVTAVLSEVCGIGEEAAATLPSTVFVGVCLGSLVLSYMLTKAYNGYSIIINCGMANILAFVSILSGGCGTVTKVFVLLLIIGFCAAYQLVAVCKAIEYVGESAVALATAVSNMVIMVFGYFFHTFIAFVVNTYWTGEIIGGHALYGKEVLIKAVAVVPVLCLIGTVGFGILKWREEKH